jgi:hypothetical protein
VSHEPHEMPEIDFPRKRRMYWGMASTPPESPSAGPSPHVKTSLPTAH